MSASENVEIAKRGMRRTRRAMSKRPWPTSMTTSSGRYPVTAAISGVYRGKDKFMELLGKLAEKSFTTTPERILGDGDDVVVITKITAGGESGLQADVLTYRSGKLMKALSIADTALQERVFGRK